jgi:hypothetical protein
MRRAIAIILGVIAIAACACSGGSSASKTTATTAATVSDAVFKTAATAAANSAQITQADLPAGWTGAPHRADDTKLDLSPACAAFNDVDPWKSAIANVHSPDLTDAEHREVNSQAVAYRTADLANTDSSAASALLTNCGDEIGRALEASIVADAPGTTAHVTFTPLDSSNLEGWTAGYKLSVSAASATGATTYAASGGWLWKVSGRMIAAFEYSGGETTPVDASMVTTLKALIAKRLAAADATLPN